MDEAGTLLGGGGGTPPQPPPEESSEVSPVGSIANRPMSSLPVPPNVNPDVTVAHQSLMGKMFHGALSAMGFGGADVSYQRDPETGKMVTTQTPKSPGDWARGIIAGALTGMAGAASAPKGSGPIGAAGAGFMAQKNSMEHDDQTARANANTDFETEQRTAYQKANVAMLNQRVAEGTWDLSNKKLDQSFKVADRDNEFSQRIAQDPNSRDLGVFSSFEDMVKNHKEMAPDLIKQHMAGNVVVHPSVGEDGKVNGVHFAIVSPEWKNQKIAEDVQIPVFHAPKKQGEDPTVEMKTVPAGSMTNGEYETVNMAHWNQYLGYKTGQDKLESAREIAGYRSEAAAARSEAAASRLETTRADKSYGAAKSDLEGVGKPIDAISARLGRLKDSLRVGNPVADALVAPELLTIMAGGRDSGLRMTEAEIVRIVGGRSAWESLKASANKWNLDPAAANSITDAQRKQIRALVSTVETKLQAKQQILQESRDALINTDDPKEHRRIVVRAKQQINDVDEGKATIIKAKADQNQPPRPDNVPEGYIYQESGPKGRGWYKPNAR